MPGLAVASREQIHSIYRESHSLWGVGLSPEDYSALWDEISRTPWARRHARFYVWVREDGEVLSSLKHYRPQIRVLDRVARVSVIGAVFTPRSHRRQGHAAALLEAVLTRARQAGDPLALLFSDIGTDYYEELGFRTLPAEEHWGALPRRSAETHAGWSLRPCMESDVPSIRQAHSDSSARRPIAVLRDEEHWDFLDVRTRAYFDRIEDSEIRQSTQVALHAGRLRGFLTAVEGRGEWNVREVGVLGGDPADQARVLRAGAEQARREGLRRIYAWLPPEVVRELGDWRLRRRRRRRAVPMALALESTLELSRLESVDGGYIPYQDQF